MQELRVHAVDPSPDVLAFPETRERQLIKDAELTISRYDCSETIALMTEKVAR